MPTIDQMPLDWYMRPGVKLDFRRFADGYVVRAEDVEEELARIGHKLEPLDIVLVNTSAGGAYGKPDFNNKGCGMGREATMYLLDRGIRVTGTDAWGWDAPFALPPSAGRRTTIPRSSGKATTRASRNPTATWRSCRTWRRCRPTASSSPASR